MQSLGLRLQSLGFFEDEPTGYYGEVSMEAVRSFERENGLEADGYLSTEDLILLFSAEVKPLPAENN